MSLFGWLTGDFIDPKWVQNARAVAVERNKNDKRTMVQRIAALEEIDPKLWCASDTEIRAAWGDPNRAKEIRFSTGERGLYWEHWRTGTDHQRALVVHIFQHFKDGWALVDRTIVAATA